MKALIAFFCLFAIAAANPPLPRPIINALEQAQQSIGQQYSREFQVRYLRQEADKDPVNWLLAYHPGHDTRWQLMEGEQGEPTSSEIREANRRWNRRNSDNEQGQIELDLAKTHIIERGDLWKLSLGLQFIRNGKTEDRLSEAIEAYAWFDPQQQMITRLVANSVEPFRVYVLSVEHFAIDMHFTKLGTELVMASSEQSVRANALLWQWNQTTRYDYLY